MNTSRRCLIIFFLLTVFCAAVHWMLNLPLNGMHPEVINGDAFDYHVAAQWLYQEGFRPHPTRMFGFPVLTGWIVLFDNSFEAFYTTCYVLNAIWWLSTIGLLMWIGRRLMGKASWLALLPAIAFGLNLGNILLISQPISETLYTFLLTASLTLLLRDDGRLVSGWALVAFGCFCFSLVVRPTGAIWLLVLVPVLFRRWWLSAPSRLALLAGGLAILCSTIGIQTLNIHRAFGQWQTTNIGLFTHYLYLDAYASYAIGPDTWEQKGLNWYAERDRRLNGLGIGVPVWKGVHRVRNWQAIADTMRLQVWHTVRENPGGLALGYMRSLYSNAMNGSNIALLSERVPDDRVARNGAWLFWVSSWQNRVMTGLAGLLVVFFTLRIVRSSSRRVDWILWLASLFGGTILLLSAISFAQGDRFAVVVAPFTVVGAMWVISRLFVPRADQAGGQIDLK